MMLDLGKWHADRPGWLWYLLALFTWLLVVVVMLFPPVACAQQAGGSQNGQGGCQFLDHWVQMESRGDPMAANGHSTAVGRWQMTQAAFVDVGLIQQNSRVTSAHYGGREWTNVTFRDNPFGIRNLQDLRANPAAQDYYGRLYHQMQWQSAQRQGLVRDFVGQTVNVGGRQVQINESALLTCMGYLGAGDCGRMLRGQPMANPQNTAHALWRMSRASACDGSDLAGQNTQVDAQANLAATADGMYCDPTVLQRLEQAAVTQVNALTALAAHPQVGYRTAEGGSPLQALGQEGDEMLRALGLAGMFSGGTGGVFSTGGFRALSCLDNLLGGVNVIFAPPSLPNILGMLESYVCRQVEGLYRQAVAPLNQNFFRDFGVGGVSVPIGVGVSMRGAPGIRVNSSNVMSWGRNSSAFDMFGQSAIPRSPVPTQGGGIFRR